jgi:hypothetical protein
MAKINQLLLERLESELGVGKAQVYSRIQQVVRRTMLDRHLAALVLAVESGINIHKYSTPEQRAGLGGARNVAGAAKEAAVDLRRSGRTHGTARRVAERSKNPKKDNSVFVVYGRNEGLRKSMFGFLRALGLNPLEWSKAVLMANGANPYVGEILDDAMGRVQAVIVLLSPDEEAKLKGEFCARTEKRTEGRLGGQPRPNVIFEAGLAMGRHPEKTLLVQVGRSRGFTDIVGKHVPKLTNEVGSRNDVANRLRKIIGSKVDTTGDDWRTVGDFTA